MQENIWEYVFIWFLISLVNQNFDGCHKFSLKVCKSLMRVWRTKKSHYHSSHGAAVETKTNQHKQCKKDFSFKTFNPLTHGRFYRPDQHARSSIPSNILIWKFGNELNIKIQEAIHVSSHSNFFPGTLRQTLPHRWRFLSFVRHSTYTLRATLALYKKDFKK